MKNIKLLLATTAMLSMGAMTANAELASNQTTLGVGASFINPIQTIKESNLGFGVILADEGNKYVIVTPEGELGEGSDAMMLDMPKPATNYSTGPNTTWHTDMAFLPGRIRFKNASAGDSTGLSEEELQAANAYLNTSLKLVFSSPSVTLKSVSSEQYGITCGTVDTFTTKFSADGSDLIAKIGGKLKTEDLRAITGPIDCEGETTITLVYNSDNTTSELNAALAETIALNEGN